MAEPTAPDRGVQALISRIRDQGVEAGRTEGERLLIEAKEEAARILADAEKTAAETLERAREKIKKEEDSSMEALRMAARDTGLHLRQAVLTSFEQHVRRLVTDVTLDGEFLRALVLVLAGQAADDYVKDKSVRIQVAKFIAGEEDEEMAEQEKRAVLALSNLMLRDGIELVSSDEVQGGARVQIVDDRLEIDLTDDAIATLLLGRMLPRFRSILEGVE